MRSRAGGSWCSPRTSPTWSRATSDLSRDASEADVSRGTWALAGPAQFLARRCEALGVALPAGAAGELVALLDRIGVEDQNLTAITGLREGVERHLLDSLAGLVVPELRRASTLVDLGSGAGFPGLALAAARPDLLVTLVESEQRKADWLRRAASGRSNVRVAAVRAEDLARAERERWAVATARALGPLAVCLELAAPLVARDGVLVVWRGDDASGGDDRGTGAAGKLGFDGGAVIPVEPFPGARRHLRRYVKVADTPRRFPRRAGRAAKRPLA